MTIDFSQMRKEQGTEELSNIFFSVTKGTEVAFWPKGQFNPSPINTTWLQVNPLENKILLKWPRPEDRAFALEVHSQYFFLIKNRRLIFESTLLHSTASEMAIRPPESVILPEKRHADRVFAGNDAKIEVKTQDGERGDFALLEKGNNGLSFIASGAWASKFYRAGIIFLEGLNSRPVKIRSITQIKKERPNESQFYRVGVAYL